MLKRTIFISSPNSLRLKDNQMVIQSKEDAELVNKVPIEDVGFLVIENPQTYISIPLLNALTEYNVSVTFCNNHGMPKSMLLNLDANSTQGESYQRQIQVSEPLKKNLWKQIIESKIRNQALLLEKLGLEGQRVLYCSKDVKSGDTDNREGVAAKIYWSMLFGDEFYRDRYGITPNNLLNYGYSLLRSATARAIVGSGLLPVFGLFHHNRYNSYPLADDLMEPFRPYVDEVAFRLYANGMTELTKDVKAEFAKVLYADTMADKMTRPLSLALTYAAASLTRCYYGEQKKLVLPYFM